MRKDTAAFLEWKKRIESKSEEKEVREARTLNLAELREDCDSVVSKEYSELEDLL
jgi:hypothetical protein